MGMKKLIKSVNDLQKLCLLQFWLRLSVIVGEIAVTSTENKFLLMKKCKAMRKRYFKNTYH